MKALVMEIQPNKYEIEAKSKILAGIIDILYELDIAHNVVIVRSKNTYTRYETNIVKHTQIPLLWSFFIFPRVKADTAIVSQCVDPACVEFSGQFPCKDEYEWKNLTMEKAVELLGSVKIDKSLEKQLFDRLKTSIWFEHLASFIALERDFRQNMFSYKLEDLKYLKQDFDNQTLSDLDIRLEAAFSKSMELGMLRYKQPKGVNEIKVVHNISKYILT